jgi:beta-phosphoglucomutase-like phosphatase (HAD superfamily)
MTPGLVIFDCDGVLVDSEGISMRELTRAIAGAGGTLSPHEVGETFTGVSLAAIEDGVAAHLGRPAPPGWLEAWLAVRATAFERELQPIAGAAAAVEGVRALGCETCVASQGSVAKMDLTLRVTALQACFPAPRIFSGAMVEHGKPAPDLYLHAAAECGFAVSDCVVIEDSVTGVTAARAAGMRTLGYVAGAAAGGPLPARLAGLGAEVFHDMREVPRRVAAG